MNNVSAMVEIFHKGGYVMYILLLLSLAVVAIAIDRYLFFKRSDSGRQFAREFYGLLHQKEYAQAFALARESHGTMAEVICEAADGYLEDSQGLASYLEIQSGIMLSQFNAKLYFLSVGGYHGASPGAPGDHYRDDRRFQRAEHLFRGHGHHRGGGGSPDCHRQRDLCGAGSSGGPLLLQTADRRDHHRHGTGFL